MAARIKKGDTVVVLAGKDKGQSGEVLKVFVEGGKALVQGVNMVKRHVRPTQQDPQGGIVDKEAPIHLSNVALRDPQDGRPTRVGFKVLENGKKVRVAKRSGEVIDV